MRVNILIAAVACVVLSGCATVTRGTTEEVRIEVDPPDAKITTTVGHTCTGIPCKVIVPRRTEFSVTAEKAGYQPATVAVRTELSGGGAAGMVGNAIVGGVIGVGVDAISGAALSHVPNPVLIALVPLDPRNPATPPGNVLLLHEKLKAEQLARDRQRAANAGS